MKWNPNLLKINQIKKKGKNNTATEQADIPLTVEVMKSERKINFNCVIADEGQLYIRKIIFNGAVVNVWNMKESHQHKLYNYLQFLGISDGTAHFIQQFNRGNYYNNYLQTIEQLKEFFKK